MPVLCVDDAFGSWCGAWAFDRLEVRRSLEGDGVLREMGLVLLKAGVAGCAIANSFAQRVSWSSVFRLRDEVESGVFEAGGCLAARGLSEIGYSELFR